MDKLFSDILTPEPIGFRRKRPPYEQHAPVNEADIQGLERRVGCVLPEDLRAWLLYAGMGDVADTLSLRPTWFTSLDVGPGPEYKVFAQDERGDLYAFRHPTGEIYHISRSMGGFARIASDFREFLTQLVGREYRLLEWVDELTLQRL
jgi:hypothetical protein